MARITTHVLDTCRGIPGRGIAVSLYRLKPDQQREIITATVTNHDGRCDQPLLEGEALTTGYYEIDFEVGDYFKSLKAGEQQIPFLDRVTLRFGVGDASGHYHVPLVVTPWSYSTYRGS
ncbi:MAG: hydroxyisourate hydrolase [Candidatus Pacebacteria bacterium]|nr:hydroxyisourate hydrolase [Candidatus Paceibacterota bacterium]